MFLMRACGYGLCTSARWSMLRKQDVVEVMAAALNKTQVFLALHRTPIACAAAVSVVVDMCLLPSVPWEQVWRVHRRLAAPLSRCFGSRCSGKDCPRALRGSRASLGCGIVLEHHVAPSSSCPACSSRIAGRAGPRNACCTGWSLPPCASPSTVVISWPSACTANIVHDFTARSPSSATTQQPQLDESQPTCVPVRPQSSRKKVRQQHARLDVPLVLACR